MEKLQEYLALIDQSFLGIGLGQWLAAAGILVVTLLVKRILANFFTRLIFKALQSTSSEMDEQLLKKQRRPAELLILLIGLFLILQVLQLPQEPKDLDGIARNLLHLLLTFNIAWFLYNLVAMLEHWLSHWAGKTESTLDDQLIPFIRKTLRVFIVFMALLMLVQNLGYSISGLLASLGLGGLAVALAAKDSLSNIFGSIMILLDRPFTLGDWVKVGDMEGTIEEVGFRSTRIRTFAKTQITVPNSVLMNMSIDNYSRMPKRRIKMSVGVTYATSPQQMRQAVADIRQMLRDHPAIDQEFFLVNFTDFGASSLDIMVYCFTSSTIWTEYLTAREDVCLRIMEILETLGLEIAFPSRTIYLQEEQPTPLDEPTAAG